MAEETPRFGIPYPSRGQADYFSVYQSGMNTIDSIVFAEWAARNSVLHGGGTMTWDLIGSDYEFTHTDAISFQTPAFGSAQSIAASTTVVAPAHFLIVDVARGASSGSSSLVFYAATQVPVDNASTVVAWHNPDTNELVFQTGLVIALGGSATGVQPQGGGGGSISVTDGTTTVSPTTAIDFTAGAVVTDGGGGTAEVLIPLTTKFVVSLDATTQYSTIQGAIDDAHAAWVASGYQRHQVIHIRPGTYTEDLSIYAGIRLVADAEPQTTTPSSAVWGGSYGANPTACVTVVGNHAFASDSFTSASFRGIAFVAGDSAATVFVADGTGGEIGNIVQFFDCSFYQEPDNGTVGLFTATTLTTDTSFHFEDCRFFYIFGGWGCQMFMVVGQTKFVRCSFDTSGYGGSIFLDTDNNANGTFLFEGCWLTVVDVRVGYNNGYATSVTYKDTVHTGPEAACIITENTQHTISLINSTCLSQDGEPVSYSNAGGGTFVYDKLSINPLGAAYIAVDYAYGGAPVTKITADQVRGVTYVYTYPGTIDLTAVPYAFTAVSWDTSLNGVGARTVNLPNANLLQGMTFTVWDSGGMANSRNIAVTSTGSAGGVIGPNTSITHASGSLMFLATTNKLNQACWRAVSYFH